MKNSLELIDEKNQVNERMQQLINAGKKEERKLNDDENTEFNELKNQVDEIDKQLENIEKENRSIEEIEKKKITEKRMNEFNLISAIKNVVENRSMDENYTNFIEKGREELRNSGLSAKGQIQIPLNYRSIAVSNASANVATDTTSIVEKLRANMVLASAGAQFLTGLVGDMEIPKYSGSSCTFKGEVSSADNGEGVFESVTLHPFRLTSILEISKQFLIQDNNNAESILVADLAKAFSEKIESTILSATAATATNFAGLFIGATSGLTATYSNIVDLEGQLEDKNVINYKYIINPKSKVALKSAKKTEGKMIFEDGQVDGIETYSTSNVMAKGVLVLDPSDLIIAQWGAMDITIDPFTLAQDGKIRLIANMYVDAKMRRDSFVAAILA